MSLSEKLIVAAKKGNAREVRKLLGRGALFTKDQYGNTALHEAAWNGNKDIVKSLLGAFCFVDSINHTGFTSLHLASQNGHAKVVKTLLKWRADPSLLNQHGETALHLVAKYNHPAVISAFGAFKISMDFRGKDGHTALHIAAKLGNIEVMKSLLQNGADPTLQNMIGQNALDLAEAGKYKDSVKLIQSAISKWKPKAGGSEGSNNYTEGLPPVSIKRAQTYGSTSSAAKTATKIRLMKTKKEAKRYSFSKERRQKSGYFSEDETYRTQVPGHAHIISSQEVPNGFAYGSGIGSERNGFPRGATMGEECQDFLMGPRSTSPKNASIDQLLSEMEREYYGPGYSFSPPADKDKSNGLITPYAEIRQLEPPRPVSPQVTPPPQGGDTITRPNRRTLRSLDIDQVNYDYLRPTEMQNAGGLNSSTGSTSSSHAHFLQRHNSNSSSGSYTQQGVTSVSPHIGQRLPMSSRLSKSPSRSPHHAPVKSSRSSCFPARASFSFPTREEVVKAGSVDDMDTYVYMAPVSDLTDEEAATAGHMMAGRAALDIEIDLESDGEESVQLREAAAGSEVSSVTGGENGSRNSKRAVICNSPLEVDKRHEPNSNLAPVKGILSQSSVNETADKSHLEKYLQEELDTMRQAFQIRLGQLEKRYKRQLIFEQQKNHSSKSQSTSSPSKVVTQRRRHMSDQTNSSVRRNSWHSYIPSEQELDKLAEPDGPRSGSSLGIDSDHSVDGSDIEVWETDDDEETKAETAKKSVRIAGVEGTKGPEARDPQTHDNTYSTPRSARDPPTTKATYSTPRSTKDSSPPAVHGDHTYSTPRSAWTSTNGTVTGGEATYSIPRSARDIHGNVPMYSTPTKAKVGLKGGAKSWRDESTETTLDSPKLSPVSNELSQDDSIAIDDDAKALIQIKLDEYRGKMMKYFQEKSEAQISVIEEKYQKQMAEVRRKYNNEASEKVSHLTTRIKDLENMLDVQTLV